MKAGPSATTFYLSTAGPYCELQLSCGCCSAQASASPLSTDLEGTSKRLKAKSQVCASWRACSPALAATCACCPIQVLHILLCCYWENCLHQEVYMQACSSVNLQHLQFCKCSAGCLLDVKTCHGSFAMALINRDCHRLSGPWLSYCLCKQL